MRRKYPKNILKKITKYLLPENQSTGAECTLYTVHCTLYTVQIINHDRTPKASGITDWPAFEVRLSSAFTTLTNNRIVFEDFYRVGFNSEVELAVVKTCVGTSGVFRGFSQSLQEMKEFLHIYRVAASFRVFILYGSFNN